MAHDDLFTGLLTAGLPLSQKGQGKILASFSVLLSMDCRQLNLILIRRSGHPAVRMTPLLAEEKIIRHVAVAVRVHVAFAGIGAIVDQVSIVLAGTERRRRAGHDVAGIIQYLDGFAIVVTTATKCLIPLLVSDRIRFDQSGIRPAGP